MVLLRSLSDEAIVDNLKKRLAAKAIFVSVHSVVLSILFSSDLHWSSVDLR